MPDHAELVVLTVFQAPDGALRATAVHLEDWSAEWTQSYVLAIDERGAATVIDDAPYLLDQCWQADHGEVYFPLRGGTMVRPTAAHGWSTSTITSPSERFESMHGISGRSPDDDAVFVLSNEGLFVRRPGATAFQAHALPDGVAMVNDVHGLAPDALYVASEAGLLRFDGTTIEAVDGPEEELFAVLVVSDAERWVVGDGLRRFRDGAGWEEVDTPTTKLTGAMVQLDGAIWIATFDGPLRVDAAGATLDDDLDCNRLFVVRDTLFASGCDGGLKMRRGGTWQRVQLPALAAKS